MLDKVITVDPGVNTGLAQWKGHNTPSTDEIIWKGGRLSDGDNGTNFLQYMGHEFGRMLFHALPEVVIIEGVEVWAGSLKSETSAHKGDLIWLSYLVGVYANEAINRARAIVHIVPAREWKGQLTKEATAARVKRILSLTYKNDHITDAVGIGLWYDNRFNLGVKHERL